MFKSDMRNLLITFPLIVASLDYRKEQTSQYSSLRGLAKRLIVAPKDQLDGTRKLATTKDGIFENMTSSSQKQRTRWTRCGDKFCMEKQYCTAAKECICQKGYESDGGQGCQDFNECAVVSDDYPCPGAEGIESFCEDRDPDDGYYKCGCNPGYYATFERDYNETATGAPISFRPIKCTKVPDVVELSIDICLWSGCDIAEVDVEALKAVVLQAIFDKEDTSDITPTFEAGSCTPGCGTGNERRLQRGDGDSVLAATVGPIFVDPGICEGIVSFGCNFAPDPEKGTIFVNKFCCEIVPDPEKGTIFVNNFFEVRLEDRFQEAGINATVSNLTLKSPTEPAQSPAPVGITRRKLAEQMNEYYMKMSANRSDFDEDVPDFLTDFNETPF